MLLCRLLSQFCKTPCATPQRSRNRPLRFEHLDARELLATLPAGFEADLLAGGLYEPTAMDVAPMAGSL